jgi:hypothetical protein
MGIVRLPPVWFANIIHEDAVVFNIIIPSAKLCVFLGDLSVEYWRQRFNAENDAEVGGEKWPCYLTDKNKA